MGAGRSLAFGAVGQGFDAVHDAHGDGLATDGAAPVVGLGLLRVPADVTFAVTVEMVFALFGKEFNRAAKGGRIAAFEGGKDGIVVEIGVKEGGFAS